MRIRILVATFAATVTTLIAFPQTAHADNPVTWTVTVDGPSTVAAGVQVPLKIERSEPGPAVTVKIYKGKTFVRSVPVGAMTSTYRAIVKAPSPKRSRTVTYKIVDNTGKKVASTTVNVKVKKEQKKKVGKLGFASTAALNRKFLIGNWRWSPCRVIRVRVKPQVLVKPTRRAAKVLRNHTGLKVRVTRKPLAGGRGIVVRRANLPGRIAGLGGPRRVSGDEITRGRARIDMKKSRGMVAEVVLHEIIHALGVGHSHRHSGDLMSPHGAAGMKITSWDRAALRYAGQGRC